MSRRRQPTPEISVVVTELADGSQNDRSAHDDGRPEDQVDTHGIEHTDVVHGADAFSGDGDAAREAV